MIFFTSDTHIAHFNIIRYCDRPFTSLDEMSAKLIENWNNKVGPNDTVYHLGDIGCGSKNRTVDFFNQVNGKVILIKGNHDRRRQELKWPELQSRFEDILPYYELVVQDKDIRGGQLIVLFHYQILNWKSYRYGSYHLYGHTHQKDPRGHAVNSLNVGVDAHDFYPVSYDEIRRLMLGYWDESENQTRG